MCFYRVVRGGREGEGCDDSGGNKKDFLHQSVSLNLSYNSLERFYSFHQPSSFFSFLSFPLSLFFWFFFFVPSLSRPSDRLSRVRVTQRGVHDEFAAPAHVLGGSVCEEATLAQQNLALSAKKTSSRPSKPTQNGEEWPS
jgi:hypothetical protein